MKVSRAADQCAYKRRSSPYWSPSFPGAQPSSWHVYSVCTYVCACSVVSDSSETPWTVAAKLLCPWNSPGKNTGVGCHFLLQGVFPTQGSIPCLLCWQWILSTEPLGSPLGMYRCTFNICRVNGVQDLRARVHRQPWARILPPWGGRQPHSPRAGRMPRREARCIPGKHPLRGHLLSQCIMQMRQNGCFPYQI